ncbi:uncharacterized protein ACIQIH_011006 isoform 2-T6 [Cyanocitta cristata]
MAVAEMPSFPAGPRDRQSEEMCLVIMLEADVNIAPANACSGLHCRYCCCKPYNLNSDMQLHRQTFCKIRGILTMNYGETISRRIPNPPRLFFQREFFLVFLLILWLMP